MEWVRDLVKERKPKTLTVVILDEVILCSKRALAGHWFAIFSAGC